MKNVTELHIYLPDPDQVRSDKAEYSWRAAAFMFLARAQQFGFDLRPVSLIAGLVEAGDGQKWSLALVRDRITLRLYQVLSEKGDVHAVQYVDPAAGSVRPGLCADYRPDLFTGQYAHAA